MLCRIRLIRAEDNPVIEQIIRSCLIEFGGDHEGCAWSDPDLGRFSEIYCSEGNRYWVAEDENGTVKGGVGIGALDRNRGLCELQKMYLLPEARGTGTAKRLMETALAYASKYYDLCYIETFENMTAARRLYEKYGFQPVDHPVFDTGHYTCDIRYLKKLPRD